MTVTTTQHPDPLARTYPRGSSFITEAGAAARPFWETTPGAPAAEPVELPEPRVSKQTFAAIVGMSPRWVEQKIAAGMPCEYIDGRPRLRVSEGEDWLRERGHLKDTPNPQRGGRKAGDDA